MQKCRKEDTAIDSCAAPTATNSTVSETNWRNQCVACSHFDLLLLWIAENNSAKNFLRNDRDRRSGGDMTIRKGQNRRVSFKTQSRQNNAKIRNVELGLRSAMEEDDDMTERRRRRGSPIPRSARGKTKLIESASGWYQVVVSDHWIQRILSSKTAFFFVFARRFRTAKSTTKISCWNRCCKPFRRRFSFRTTGKRKRRTSFSTSTTSSRRERCRTPTERSTCPTDSRWLWKWKTACRPFSWTKASASAWS